MSSDSESSSKIDDLVSEMHMATARLLLADLRDPEKRTPGLYQCVLRFLKDNSVAAIAMDGSAFGELHGELMDAIKFPRSEAS